METIKTETVFVPVDGRIRLPENSMRCFVTTIEPSGQTYNKRATLFDGKWVDDTISENETVIHWLDKKENMILLTKEQFEKVANDIWDAAESRAIEESLLNENQIIQPDKQTFFNKLFNK